MLLLNKKDPYKFQTDCLFSAKENIRIIKRIAVGGMGCVYKAAFEGIDGFKKIVALKVLRSHKSNLELRTQYFINEAKLVAGLVHENIVQLNSLGKYKDRYYIVYEYINGTTLHELIQVHKLLGQAVPTYLAVYIVSRIARGLAYAHRFQDQFGDPCNIVHRDVCPRNIMMTTEGQLKLTDFGIAVARGSNAEDSFAGKPKYMSPEQAHRDKVDFRSDIYSLGLVMFELLSGTPARDTTKGEPHLLFLARNGEVSWDSLELDSESELYRILRKMLEPDPAMRYQDTNELVFDLEKSIYSDGYGPTATVFSEYLKKEMPHIFKSSDKNASPHIHQYERDFVGSDVYDENLKCPESDDYISDTKTTLII